MSAPAIRYKPTQSPATIRAAPIPSIRRSVKSHRGTRSLSSVMTALCQARMRVVMRWLTYTADRRSASLRHIAYRVEQGGGERERVGQRPSSTRRISRNRHREKPDCARSTRLAAVSRLPARCTHRRPPQGREGGEFAQKNAKGPYPDLSHAVPMRRPYRSYLGRLKPALPLPDVGASR